MAAKAAGGGEHDSAAASRDVPFGGSSRHGPPRFPLQDDDTLADVAPFLTAMQEAADGLGRQGKLVRAPFLAESHCAVLAFLTRVGDGDARDKVESAVVGYFERFGHLASAAADIAAVADPLVSRGWGGGDSVVSRRRPSLPRVIHMTSACGQSQPLGTKIARCHRVRREHVVLSPLTLISTGCGQKGTHFSPHGVGHARALVRRAQLMAGYEGCSQQHPINTRAAG